LALKSDGTPWAWGSNSYGQLGNANNADSNVPVQVSGLTGVVAMAGGYAQSLAVKSEGTGWAWGYNGNGQLGNGGSANSAVPVQVSSLRGVTGIAAGAGHSLAVKSDGTVLTWGILTWSYAFTNVGYVNSNVPVPVTGLTGAVAIAAGSEHNLALKRDGTV